MPDLELSVSQAASLLSVRENTVRRRIRTGELRARRAQGRQPVVFFDPARDFLRAQDAAGMLGVSTATVRSALVRGDLAGRQDRDGKWQVRLEAVLRDPRCDPAVVGFFSGEPPEEPIEQPPPASAHRMRRDVFVRLDEPEIELLERARDQHGGITPAIVAGLHALHEEGFTEGEASELLAERDGYRGRAERAEVELRELREQARLRLVDEAFCPTCERLVPAEEFGYVQLEDGSVELFHEPHGHRPGSRLRASTVLARRWHAAEASG